MIQASKVPRSIRIGGETFQIRVEAMDDWGQCKWDKRRITISTQALVNRATLRSTLFHEMTHAALMVSGLAWADKYDEEPIVRSLEHILFPAWDTLDAKLRKL
jgi:hypothetical protein